jgi:hypothetical protein
MLDLRPIPAAAVAGRRVQRSAPVAPRLRSRAQSTWLSRWRPGSSLIESLERPVDRMWKAARILRKVRPYFSRRRCGRPQAVEKGASFPRGALVRQTKKRAASLQRGADSLGPKLANLEGASGRKCVQAVPTKCWPCKSNSVCLGSSPRAQNRVGAFWAFDRALAAGPVQPVYSSERHPAPFRPRSRSPERCFHDNLRGHASDNVRWALLA